MAANPDVRSVVAQIVSVQEHIQIVLDGLIRLAAGSDGRVRKLALSLDESGLRHNHLAESQRQTEEKLNALISVVDGIVRQRAGNSAPDPHLG
jgi:hypothetical protein